MDATCQNAIWEQLGAALDMLENAVVACPDELWTDASRGTEPWYLAFHTLFWHDLYLSDSLAGFAPPPPFTLGELEPDVMPARPYTKPELLAYLEHGREKARATISGLTDEKARRRCPFEWVDTTVAGLLLYNLRHVQHGAAQLNLLLRQATDSAPPWVKAAKSPLGP